MTNNDLFVLGLCDRLRKLRKRLNLNIEDVADRSGLTFNQIQRLEGAIRNDSTVIKKGAKGTVTTVLTLLNFYAQKISLDVLFNLNIPVADIPLTKGVEKEISRAKLYSMIENLKEIAQHI